MCSIQTSPQGSLAKLIDSKESELTSIRTGRYHHALKANSVSGTEYILTSRGREDGWFNMTKAAKHFGKQLQNFWDLPSTVQYLVALAEILNTGKSGIFVSTKGRSGGTWAHPKLAVFFARWLDVRFAVWCDAMIEDILKGAAEVTITKPEEAIFYSL